MDDADRVRGLLLLQGTIRVLLVHAKIDETASDKLAADALHLFATSQSMDDNYARVYEELVFVEEV